MFKTAMGSVVLALSLFTANSATANETEGVYITIGATLLTTELDLSGLEIADQAIDLGSEDLDVTMINGRIGYQFNEFFAVEGEAGFGLGDDDFDRSIPVDVLGTDVNVDTNVSLGVKNYYVGFARGILPISEQFDVFARVGYGKASAEADIVGTVAGFTASGSTEDNEDGFAYGIGGQYNFTEFDGLRADYTRLDETNIISLAYARRF